MATSYMSKEVAGNLLTNTYRTQKIAQGGISLKTLSKETGSVSPPLPLSKLPSRIRENTYLLLATALALLVLSLCVFCMQFLLRAH
jgi:hypothetical protein